MVSLAEHLLILLPRYTFLTFVTSHLTTLDLGEHLDIPQQAKYDGYAVGIRSRSVLRSEGVHD